MRLPVVCTGMLMDCAYKPVLERILMLVLSDSILISYAGVLFHLSPMLY